MKKKDSGKKRQGRISGIEVIKGNDREEHVEETPDTFLTGQDQTPSPPPEVATAPGRPTMSRAQDYFIRNMLVFADAAVAKDPDGVFDVLARNFVSPGDLSWWLRRVAHEEKIRYAKGRDLVEYIRKVAHKLHRDLKEIGKPKARW